MIQLNYFGKISLNNHSPGGARTNHEYIEQVNNNTYI